MGPPPPFIPAAIAESAAMRRLLLIGLPITAALIVFAASGKYFADSAQVRHQRGLLDAESKAARHAHPLERLVTRAESTLSAFASVAANSGMMTPSALDTTALALLQPHHGLSALELRGGGGYRRWNGDEMSNTLRISNNATGAKPPASLFLQPTPSTRFEDGRLILSQTLLEKKAGGTISVWGTAQVEITLKRIMLDTNLSGLLKQGHEIQLIYQSDDGSIAGLIAGNPQPIPDAREHHIDLPSGSRFRLAVRPITGLNAGQLLHAELALAAVASALLAVFLYAAMRKATTLMLGAGYAVTQQPVK